MMPAVLPLVLVTIALWIGVAGKAYQVWRAPDDLPLRAVGACLLCLAIAPVLSLPPVQAAVDGLGLPGISRLLVNVVTMLAAYWLLAFFMYSTRASTGRQWVPLVLALIVLVIAWLLAPDAVRIAPASLDNGDDPRATVFVVAAIGYMTYAMGFAARWALIYARAATTRVGLRRGLLTISVGLIVLLAGAATKVVVAVCQVLTGADPWWLENANAAYIALVLLGSVVLVIGVSYPAVSGMAAAFGVWRRHRRSYHELEPLWRVLHEAFPDLALHTEVMPWWRRRVHRDYYRRAIEIRDGLVQLGPYYDHSPESSDSSAQARSILAALRAKAAGQPVGEPKPIPITGGPDLDSDVRWLVELSRCLT